MILVFARVFGWLAALPYLVVALLVLTGGTTWSAVAYVIALGLVVAGLMTLPFPGDPPRRKAGLTRTGLGALVVVAFVRVVSVSDGRTMHVVDGSAAAGAAGSARWVSRLVDESDVALTATRALFPIGMLRDDAAEVPAAMRAAYARMHREEGHVASPFLATYLGLENPSGFDLVIVDPPAPSPARGAVMFLHGSGGNFELPCWQIARALDSLGLVTACPSTSPRADWSGEDGEAIVRRTLDVLRARGITRIVLAGLSAGGYGASLLAPRMKGTFAGLVLISGAMPDAAKAEVPTLVIHGRNDTMADFSDGSTYASRTGARLFAVDAGHFALLVKNDLVGRELRAFLETTLAK